MRSPGKSHAFTHHSKLCNQIRITQYSDNVTATEEKKRVMISSLFLQILYPLNSVYWTEYWYLTYSTPWELVKIRHSDGAGTTFIPGLVTRILTKILTQCDSLNIECLMRDEAHDFITWPRWLSFAWCSLIMAEKLPPHGSAFTEIRRDDEDHKWHNVLGSRYFPQAICRQVWWFIGSISRMESQRCLSFHLQHHGNICETARGGEVYSLWLEKAVQLIFRHACMQNFQNNLLVIWF